MFKLRIVNIKRFCTSIILLVGIISGIVFLLSNNTYSHTEIKEYKTVDIISGDTLWSIAEKQQKNNPYYEGKEIGYIIYDIKQNNALNTNSLSIGQELKIPTI